MSELAEQIVRSWEENPMRKPRITKVTLNIGVGQSGEKLAKAMKVLETITGRKPAPRRAKKTERAFGFKKGEAIGAVVTLRGEEAAATLKRLLEAVSFRVKASSIDAHGNVCFGIPEHIQIPGIRYDPAIGIFGLDVCITIQRPGHRVVERRRAKGRIPRRHRVTREESMILLSQAFGVNFV